LLVFEYVKTIADKKKTSFEKLNTWKLFFFGHVLIIDQNEFEMTERN